MEKGNIKKISHHQKEIKKIKFFIILKSFFYVFRKERYNLFKNNYTIESYLLILPLNVELPYVYLIAPAINEICPPGKAVPR